MAKISNVNKAIEEAKTGDYVITDKKTNKEYLYGDNPYMDMQIENACFVDMFPEEVTDATDYFGFNREDYILGKVMKFGDKVQVLSYDKNAHKYFRPAEVSFDLGEGCVQVRFLDERFCKGGRAKETVTVLRKLIVMEEPQCK